MDPRGNANSTYPCFENFGIELEDRKDASLQEETSTISKHDQLARESTQQPANQQRKLPRGRKNGIKIVVDKGSKESGQDETSSDTSQYPEYLNYGEEDEMEIEGYRRSRGKTFLTWLFIFLSLGILRLIFHWWPRLMLYATHNRCLIADAEKVLIIEQYQQKYKRYYVKTVFTVSSNLFRTRLENGLHSNCSDCQWNSECSESVRTITGGGVFCADEEGSMGTVGTGDDILMEDTDPHLKPPEINRRRRAASSCHTSLSKSYLLRWLLDIIFSIRKQSSRTNKLFIAAGLPQDQTHNESSKVWDQRLEQELLHIESPKLAIPKSDGTVRETQSVRIFTCKKLRYIWDDQYGAFVKLPGFDQANTHQLHQNNGLSIFQQCQRRLIYGNNEIKVEVKSIIKLLFLEVLNPFYVFQIFSVTLWLSDNYVYFSVAIIIMSVFGIASTIIQTRKNQQKLRTTVQSSDLVVVSRGEGVLETIPTEYLVPGDVIVIPPHGCTMHCDAALLSGNCIVNESMLTGESVPVTKIPLPNRSDYMYNAKEHARHTLFCGTHVIQTRYYGQERVLAVVLRSGFLTAKGSLVRSIMYPPPVDYKFETDSYKFVAVLACIAGIGFINSIFTKLRHGESVRNIIVDSLDLITIVVPPALPAAMTVGRLYAQRRLQKKAIYCISPRAINVSGSIDCVCFDKTGTLTEEGLDLWGAVPSVFRSSKNNTIQTTEEVSAKFQPPVRQSSHLSHGPLMIGMSACHSLTRIDGELIGDPLDLKMFEWTTWTLEEPGVADNEKFDMITPTIVFPRNEKKDNILKGDDDSEVASEVGIIRQFPFSSSLQRMSVMTRTLGGTEFELYCKGSPEMITSLSLKETVPDNFNSVLETYTQEGYRVIAIGYKKLVLNYAKAQRVVREEVETELTFLGLIVLENRLKPATTAEMEVLKNAGIRTIMVTGDNMLTALSVARECGMVEMKEKVIVINTEIESDVRDEKIVRKPSISFSLVNKQDVGGTQSPVSTASEMSGMGSIMDQNLINIEAPSNFYHFAVTGNAFAVVKTHYPDLLPKVLVRGTVFARMSPDQKQQLVEHLQALGYFVGMCGDGANDCGALKAAHAGISLSEAESSVASPFTSKEANINCVPNVIREGRAALVTSFGIFKYMAVYSLTQFVTVIILYTIQSNLSDKQFLYIDLFLISVFALFFGHTKPYDGPLVRQPPSASLVSAPPIVSIICHMAAIVAVQVTAFLYVQQQPWFTPYQPKEDVYASYENYALFSVSTFQYIIMAIVFSRGEPYRQSLTTNHRLLASLVILTAFTLYLVLYPCTWLMTNFELQLPPSFEFRLTLVGFAACNLVVAFLIEQGFVNVFVAKKFGYKWTNSKKEHVRIDKDLSLNTNWPPLVTLPSMPTGGKQGSYGKDSQFVAGNNNISSLNAASNHSNAVSRRHSHSSALTIPIPKSEFYRRPRSQNSHSLSTTSNTTAEWEPNKLKTSLNGPLKNSHNDCRIALDILPPDCRS